MEFNKEEPKSASILIDGEHIYSLCEKKFFKDEINLHLNNLDENDTALTKDQIRILRRAFDNLDPQKKGVISVDDLGTILDLLGQHQNENTLKELVASVDKEGNGTLTFDELCELGTRFMGEEEEDLDKVREELREAFRLYDREGNGYITTETLREILQELDPNLSYSDLDQIIEEVDADESGTVDFEEFMEMMIG